MVGFHFAIGMPRLLKDRDLHPVERRIALMRVAGATIDTIAYMMETDAGTVRDVVSRPRVANFILLLSGIASDGLEDGLVDLNKAIETTAREAFEIETKNMRELDQIGEYVGLEAKDVIKAKFSASSIAQDILDRAGKKAPTRVISTNLHGTIPTEAIDRLADVVREMHQAIDVTPNDENTDVD